jgi:hypothetical protein
MEIVRYVDFRSHVEVFSRSWPDEIVLISPFLIYCSSVHFQSRCSSHLSITSMFERML